MRTETVPSLRGALAAGSAAALLKLALSLPFAGRYGWQRDELYFLQASRHLSFGYVDFPPVTALVGRGVVEVFGPSLVALRLSCVAAGMLAIVLVALCVRELGGSLRAQLAASLLLTLTPFGLGLGALFHPTMFDAPVWVAFSYVALRIVRRPEPRLLPLLGLIAGIGLETKSTIAVLLVVFAASVALLGPRELFLDRRAWVGAGISVLCLVPYLAWEVAHGWPSWAFLSSQASKTAEDTSQPAYVGEQIAFLAGALPIVVAGVISLWRSRRLRALALLFPAVSLVFFLEQGRSYYALPAFALPLAAGVIATERWSSGSRRRAWSLAALGVVNLAALAIVGPLVWPVLPERTMIDRGIWDQTFYKDEIGWPELVDETAAAWRAIPIGQRRDTALLAQNYGEAGALARTGSAHGLPHVLSGHLSFQYWRPASLPQHHLLTVGVDTSELRLICTRWRIVERIENDRHVGNEEQGRSIARCTLRRSLGDIWASQIASDDL